MTVSRRTPGVFYGAKNGYKSMDESYIAKSCTSVQKRKKPTRVAMALSCPSVFLPVVDCHYFAKRILEDEPTDRGLVIGFD
jgi:hypothetical protein